MVVNPNMSSWYEVGFDLSDSMQPLALAKGEGLVKSGEPLRFVRSSSLLQEGEWKSVSPNHARAKVLNDIEVVLNWLNENYPNGAP